MVRIIIEIDGKEVAEKTIESFAATTVRPAQSWESAEAGALVATDAGPAPGGAAIWSLTESPEGDAAPMDAGPATAPGPG